MTSSELRLKLWKSWQIYLTSKIIYTERKWANISAICINTLYITEIKGDEQFVIEYLAVQLKKNKNKKNLSYISFHWNAIQPHKSPPKIHIWDWEARFLVFSKKLGGIFTYINVIKKC